jgi:DNA-binding LacI/PurR family transcriptional regulator
MPDLQLNLPLPRRGARWALREQVRKYLEDKRPSVGARFLTDQELVEASGLSRITVRKAMDDLAHEGWIERRNGKGTFIGPRAGIPILASLSRNQAGPKLARLAVVGMERSDWYAGAFLRGVDDVAADCGVAVELLSNRQDLARFVQRLTQNVPDLLVFLAADVADVFHLAEARRLGIRTVVTGTNLTQLPVPGIASDDIGGMAMGVRHLVERGHRRIGYVQSTGSTRPWTVRRRQGWLRGLEEAGVEPDEGLVLWVDDRASLDEYAAIVRRYLERERPTAVVAGNSLAGVGLGRMAGAGLLRIPEELSVVTFDQDLPRYQVAFGEHLKPTMIAQPLDEIGRRLTQLTRTLADGGAIGSMSALPCRVVEGNTVRTLSP